MRIKAINWVQLTDNQKTMLLEIAAAQNWMGRVKR